MFAQIVKGPQKRREFNEFRNGEFLVALTSGAVGVKYDDTILWVTGESVGKFTNDGAIAPYKVYGVPADVVITT